MLGKVLQKGVQLVHGGAGAVFFRRVAYLKAGAQADGFGIEGADLALRIFFLEFGDGLVHALEGRRHFMRERDIVDILPFGEYGLEIIEIILLVDGGSGGHGACAHAVVKMAEIRLFAQVIIKFFAVQHIGHTDDVQAVFLGGRVPQLAVRIAEKLIHKSIVPFVKSRLPPLLLLYPICGRKATDCAYFRTFYGQIWRNCPFPAGSS